MKRLAIVAAAVFGFMGIAAFVAPSADAAAGSTCSGIRIHLSIQGSDVVNLCLPDDLLGP